MIQRVPEAMERATHPRQAAILLTDGVDNASAISAGEATRIARGMSTPIYVLGIEPPPRPPEDSGVPYEEILRLIADSSGGYYQRVPKATEMPAVVKSLLVELSSRYILSFTTSAIGISKWRNLEVRVDGYVASTRKGYVGTLP